MKNKDIKVLFFGTPYFGAKTLEFLSSADFDIVGVVTLPDKKSGRNKQLIPSAVKLAANQLHLPLFQPADDKELTDILNQIKPDVAVVSAYGKLLPENILGMPKYNSVNVHGSLLPKYRGPSPITTTILNGDTETGITIIKMVKQLDAGPIISKVKVAIDPDETKESLTKKLAKLGSEEICRVLPLYIGGQVTPVNQDEKQVTFCSIIKKDDGRIDWHQKANDIEKMIRAYFPWPNAYTCWKDKTLKIMQARVVKKTLKPGCVALSENSILVGCGQDSLEILKLQLAGKKPMAVREFLCGNSAINGTTLK